MRNAAVRGARPLLLVLVGCQPTTVSTPASAPESAARVAPEAAADWAVYMQPPRVSMGQIDADIWEDGELVVSPLQVRAYRDADGQRYSRDFPIRPFLAAAGGDGGMLWATAAAAVYRTADPVARLEPVEGLHAWSVAALGSWGIACSEGEVVRVPLQGPLELEPLRLPCERVESIAGELYVKDAEGWSMTSDLQTFVSAARPQRGRGAAHRPRGPNLGAIVTVANTWRGTDGSLTDFHGPAGLGSEDSAPGKVPKPMHCQHAVGVSGLRQLCSDAERGDTLSRWDGEWVQLHAREGTESAWLRGALSRFSESAAFTGPCEAEAELDPGELAICVIEPGREPYTHHWIPERCGPGDTCGRGEENDDRGARGDRDFVLLDLARIEAGLVTYSLSPRSEETYLLDLRGDARGKLPRCEHPRLVGPAHLECTSQGEGLRVFALDDGAVTEIAVPTTTVSAGFATATHGLAAGVDASSLWATRDAGASWQPVEVELVGAPASLPLARVECSNLACAAGPAVWVEAEAAEELQLESVSYSGFMRTLFREE